jgi:hypothetical protein
VVRFFALVLPLVPLAAAWAAVSAVVIGVQSRLGEIQNQRFRTADTKVEMDEHDVRVGIRHTGHSGFGNSDALLA